jgi:hypothetical protein
MLRRTRNRTPPVSKFSLHSLLLNHSLIKRVESLAVRGLSQFEKKLLIIAKKMLFDDDVLAGDRALSAFTPVHAGAREDGDEDDSEEELAEDYKKEVVGYTGKIKNQVQFDYVVSLVSAGLMFQQVSAVVKKNHDHLGAASKSGCVSLGEASSFARIVCALSLDIINELMNKTWAFAIAADVSTDDFGNSHLDTRGQFPSIDPSKPLLSFI